METRGFSAKMSEQSFTTGSPPNPGHAPPKSAIPDASSTQAPVSVEKEPDVVNLTLESPIVNPQVYNVPVFDSVETVHDVKSSNNSIDKQEVTPASSADVKNKVEVKTDEMREMKISGRSWASNYLTSIGLSQKPIKISLSSKKKFNTAPAESILPNSAAEENIIANDNFTNLLSQPEDSAAITSGQSVQTKLTVTNPTHSTDQPEKTVNFTDSSKQQPIKTTNQLKQTEQLISIPTLVPTHIQNVTSSFQICNRDIYLQTCFDNNTDPNSNSLNNYDNEDSLQVKPFVKYDGNREVHYRPAEDKFYLDKVEEFLAKVSQNRFQKNTYHEHPSNTRSLSPLQHRDTDCNNTEKGHDIRRSNKLLYSDYVDTKLYKVDKDYLKHKKYRDAELEHRYGYKFHYTERYNEHKHYDYRERTSTSKQSYKYYKERSREYEYQYLSKNRIKCSTVVNTRFYKDKYNMIKNSRHSKIQENKILKAKNRSDSSSSEKILTRSPKLIIDHVESNNTTYKKRKRCNSCSSADDNRKRSSRYSLKNAQDEKNKIYRENRESSSSSINSEYLSELAVRKPKTEKYKQISKSRQRSGSNLSESSLKKRAGSPCQTPQTKKHKAVCNKNSETAKLVAKSPRTILKYILNEKSRETSGSSSHSKNNVDELSRLIHKSQKKYRNKSRSSSSSSSERSTLEHERDLHKSLRDTRKAQDSRKVNITTLNTNDNSQNKVSRQNNERNKTKTEKIKSNDSFVKIQDSAPHKSESKQKNRSKPKKDKYKTKIKTPDGKKVSAVGKNIKSKNEIKKTILETVMSNDKKSKLSLITQKINTSLIPSTSTNKHNCNEDNKSFVQVKENIYEKGNEKEKNFDLRSKLSRKGVLAKYFSNRYNNTLENDLNARENLIITVANQEQDEIEYCGKKIEETYEKKTDKKSKTKNCKKKKLKLVISMVCENSEDDEVNSKTNENSHDDGSVDKKNSNESTSLGEELSFLDDLDIDEIVDSLTNNINDSSIIENKDLNNVTVDSCVLISDCDESNDDSNASTVHLEELCEINEDFTDIDVENIKEDNLNVIENNNMMGGVQSSDTINVTKKSNNGVKCSIALTQGILKIKQKVLDNKFIQNNLFHKSDKDIFENKSKKEIQIVTSNKETFIEKNEQINVIKEEPTEEAKGKGIKRSKSYSDCNGTVIEIKEEPKEDLYDKQNIGSNESKRNGRPVIEIKDEPEDIYDKQNIESNQNISNGIIPVIEIKDKPEGINDKRNIESNTNISNGIIPVIEIKDEPEEIYDKRNIESNKYISNGIVPVIEIKEEPKDLCKKINIGSNGNKTNGKIPVVEIKEELEENISNKRKIESSENKSNGLIPVIKIEEKAEDINDKRNIESYEIESSCQDTQNNIIEIKEKPVERAGRKDPWSEKKQNKGRCDSLKMTLKSHTNIKEEPIEDTLIDEMTIERKKNEDKDRKLNKIPNKFEGNMETFPRNVNTQEIGTGKELPNIGIESRNKGTVHGDKNEKISEAHQKVFKNIICVSAIKDKALNPIRKEETKSQEKTNNDHEHASDVQIKIETQEEVVTHFLNESVVLDNTVQKKTKEIPVMSIKSFNIEESVTNAASKPDKIALIKSKLCPFLNFDELTKKYEIIDDSIKNNGTSDTCITNSVKQTVNLNYSERADTDNIDSLSGNNNPSIPKKDNNSEIIQENNIQSDPEAIESLILKKEQNLSSIKQDRTTNDNGKNCKTETVSKSLKKETVTTDSKTIQSPSNKQERKANDNSKKNIVFESEIDHKSLKKESNSKTETKILPPVTNLLQGDNQWCTKLEIKLSECLREPYKCTQFLHTGKFSRIYQCEGAKDQKYIVKSLSKLGDRHFREQERLLLSLQRDVPKENLHFVHYVSELAIYGRYCFVMDYYPKNLTEVLQQKKSLHICDVQRLSRQLVEALIILKKHKIIHSDIKPSHILLDSTNDRLKLCGFDGAYRVEEASSFPNIGVVNYRAPEIILGYSAGYSVDVWAAALVMFEMATARKLFPGYYDNDVLFKQMCTVGYLPVDMINQSRFRDKHFIGTSFMRRYKRSPNEPPYYTVLSENQIYKNNIMKSTVYTTYTKLWSKCITKRQKKEEMAMLDVFTGLLDQMLVMHPDKRLPIEFVYANNFMINSDFNFV